MLPVMEPLLALGTFDHHLYPVMPTPAYTPLLLLRRILQIKCLLEYLLLLLQLLPL